MVTGVYLESKHHPEFVKDFLEKTKDMTLEEIATVVWQYGNDRWSSGYTQGKYDPYFDDDTDNDDDE